MNGSTPHLRHPTAASESSREYCDLPFLVFIQFTSNLRRSVKGQKDCLNTQVENAAWTVTEMHTHEGQLLSSAKMQRVEKLEAFACCASGASALYCSIQRL